MNTRAIIILILLFSSMLGLWIVMMEISDGNYFLGLELYQIQTETERYKKENMQLNEIRLQEQSYTIIYRKALDMGFTDASYVVVK